MLFELGEALKGRDSTQGDPGRWIVIAGARCRVPPFQGWLSIIGRGWAWIPGLHPGLRSHAPLALLLMGVSENPALLPALRPCRNGLGPLFANRGLFGPENAVPGPAGGSGNSAGGSPRATGGSGNSAGGSPRVTGGSGNSAGGSPRATGGAGTYRWTGSAYAELPPCDRGRRKCDRGLRKLGRGRPPLRFGSPPPDGGKRFPGGPEPPPALSNRPVRRRRPTSAVRRRRSLCRM